MIVTRLIAQPCNKVLITFIDDNSEPIIDFKVDPHFNRLTCEINDNNNFDSFKQIDRGHNKVIYDIAKKRNDNNNSSNSSKQSNDADIEFAIIQMKELMQNIKNLQATYQDVFNISDTLQSKDTENKCDVLLELNNSTVPVWHGRKEPLTLSSSVTPCYLTLRNQKCCRKS